MTTRSSIIDASEVYLPDGSIRKYGLIYTNQCGWIDLGHANPEGKGFAGALSLWRQIRSQTSCKERVHEKAPARIIFSQSMQNRFGAKAGVTRRYEVQRHLSSEYEQKSIALAIFIDVSTAFEGLQANWFFRHVTDSGYSSEDLVSNLIGFYRAVNPGIDYIQGCDPVSKEQALAIWDTYGEVGRNKNHEFMPVFYPHPQLQCGIPRKGRLPLWLDTIKPARMGEKFKELR